MISKNQRAHIIDIVISLKFFIFSWCINEIIFVYMIYYLGLDHLHHIDTKTILPRYELILAWYI